MNQTQALAKLRKLIGPEMGYRINPKAPTAEQREEKRALIPAADAALTAAEAALVARRKALLAADSKYQQLVAQHDAAQKKREQIRAGLHDPRIRVGRVGPIFFTVIADGDNWADVVAHAQRSLTKEH